MKLTKEQLKEIIKEEMSRVEGRLLRRSPEDLEKTDRPSHGYNPPTDPDEGLSPQKIKSIQRQLYLIADRLEDDYKFQPESAAKAIRFLGKYLDHWERESLQSRK